MHEATRGRIQLVVSTALFAYYTLWLLGTVRSCREAGDLGGDSRAAEPPSPHPS